jgi:3-methyladenine DNA glycosylase AlkD
MSEKTITDGLFALKDENYRRFHAKLIPDIPIDNIIGVRTPVLRKYAKEVAKLPEANIFLESLPHSYYEENNLHGALLSLLYPKDIIDFMEQLERFLPYVDNWATCDMLSPKIFKKHLPYVYERVQKWLQSDAVYTIRFGIVTLLGFYLDNAFEPEMLQLVANVRSEEYYVNMAVAWYFSMALVKQYDATLPYIQNRVLEPWTHNKSIQKAIESRRIPQETKAYLRGLKIR